MSKLNPGQAKALREILTSHRQDQQNHLLIGPAGTGKTFLMTEVVRALQAQKVRVVVTAPTHKAVEVLSRKMDEAGVEVECMTVHKLLGLRPGSSDSEKTILRRHGEGRAYSYQAVVLDETSMVGSELQKYINHELSMHFVLYVGDKAQLPPVGEKEAPAFKIVRRSVLTEIVRQEADNPILKAAIVLREQQGGAIDWSWIHPAESANKGIFLAGADADAWLRDAFTSNAFQSDNDTFRFICYTNARVHEINRKVRRWIYGDTETPFVKDERVITRKPILINGHIPAFNTNEECVVTGIDRDEIILRLDDLDPTKGGNQKVEGWSHVLPVWQVRLFHPVSKEIACYIPINPTQMAGVERRIIKEAALNKTRWRELFGIKEQIGDLRSVYALTSHSAQGSTFDNCFVDVPDIAKRAKDNVLECQRLAYVAITRARYAVMLVGV